MYLFIHWNKQNTLQSGIRIRQKYIDLGYFIQIVKHWYTLMNSRIRD